MVHKTLWIYSGPVSGNHEVIVVITVITTNVLDWLLRTLEQEKKWLREYFFR